MPLQKEDLERLRGACRLAKKKPLQFFFCELGESGEPVLLIGKRLKAEARVVRKAAKKKRFVHGELKVGDEGALAFHSNKESSKFARALKTYFKSVVALARAEIVIEGEDVAGGDDPEEAEVDASVPKLSKADADLALWTKRAAVIQKNLARAQRDHARRAKDLGEGTLEQRMAFEALMEDIDAERDEVRDRLSALAAADTKKVSKDVKQLLAEVRETILDFLRASKKLEASLNKKMSAFQLVVLTEPVDPTQTLAAFDALLKFLEDPEIAIATRWGRKADLEEIMETLQALLAAGGATDPKVEATLNRADVLLSDLTDERWDQRGSPAVFAASAMSDSEVFALQEHIGDDLDTQLLLERIVDAHPGLRLDTATLDALGKASGLDEAQLQARVEAVAAEVPIERLPAAIALASYTPGLESDELWRILDAVNGDAESAKERVDLLLKLDFSKEREDAYLDAVNRAEAVATKEHRAKLARLEKSGGSSKKAKRETATAVTLEQQAFIDGAAARETKAKKDLEALWDVEDKEAIDERVATMPLSMCIFLAKALGKPTFTSLEVEDLQSLHRELADDEGTLARLGKTHRLSALMARVIPSDLIAWSKAFGGKWPAFTARFSPSTVEELCTHLDLKKLRKLPEALGQDAFDALGRDGIRDYLKRPQLKAFNQLSADDMAEIIEHIGVFGRVLGQADACCDLITATKSVQNAADLITAARGGSLTIAQVVTCLAHLKNKKEPTVELLSCAASAKWSSTKTLDWAASHRNASTKQVRAAVSGDVLANAPTSLDNNKLKLLLASGLAEVRFDSTFKTVTEKRSGGDTSEYGVHLQDNRGGFSTFVHWVVHIHRERGSSSRSATAVAAHLKTFKQRKKKEAARFPVHSEIITACRKTG